MSLAELLEVDGRKLYFRVEALTAVDRSTWIGRRDHTLLLMMMQTGLHLAEITALRDHDKAWHAGSN